jgi:hypothetical protein
VEIDGVIYQIFRHPSLYNNYRVELFVKRFRYNYNTEQKTPYKELTAWEERAMSIYQKACNAATATRERVKNG